jgi:lipopolysaccharide export system protein LptA
MKNLNFNLKRLIKALPILIINLIFISPCFALVSDETKPINITSDSFDANLIKHIAHYKKNVIATQGTRTLTGDLATIYGNNKNEVNKITVTGKPAKYSYQAKPEEKLSHARADLIIYEPPKNTFTMIGNAYVEQNNNVYTGHKLIYNTLDKTITSPAQRFRRGTMTLQPETFQSKKTNPKIKTNNQTKKQPV